MFWLCSCSARALFISDSESNRGASLDVALADSPVNHHAINKHARLNAKDNIHAKTYRKFIYTLFLYLEFVWNFSSKSGYPCSSIISRIAGHTPEHFGSQKGTHHTCFIYNSNTYFTNLAVIEVLGRTTEAEQESSPEFDSTRELLDSRRSLP